MKRFCFSLFGAALLGLTGCADLYPPTPKPDYRIQVVSTPKGDAAIPPTCPSWVFDRKNPYENQPDPQFGCATARNLAMMVEEPKDLLHGRELGPQRGVLAVGAMRRYDNNQTRGLIYPSSSPDMAVDVTTAPTANSPMTGDVTGAAATGGSSSSSGSGP